jgi:RNA polymerase sigma-70 factor (ECF subfamily)
MGIFSSYGKKTDEDLMALLQRGDHRAFGHIYDRYAPRLKAFFVRMLWTDQELAEDQVHDLFSKIIDRPELFKEGYLFKSWVFQVASNMCKNAYRKRAFEQAYRNQLSRDGIGFASVEKELDEEIQMNRLVTALEKMDEDLMALFLLRYQQDLSTAELARIFDVPEGTIKSRLYQVRKDLTVQLTDDIKMEKP